MCLQFYESILIGYELECPGMKQYLLCQDLVLGYRGYPASIIFVLFDSWIRYILNHSISLIPISARLCQKERDGTVAVISCHRVVMTAEFPSTSSNDLSPFTKALTPKNLFSLSETATIACIRNRQQSCHRANQTILGPSIGYKTT